MLYVNIEYVDDKIKPFDAWEVWNTYDLETKERRIDWAENQLNQEEYIGYPLDDNADGYAFPRYLIDDAKERELLDDGDTIGRATETIQRRIYTDHLKAAPEKIKEATVQLIVEYIERQDLKELQKLQTVANIESFESWSYAEPTWTRNLPKSVWEIIAYLKPITWDDAIDSTPTGRT